MSLSPAGVVHKNLAHQVRSYSKKLRPGLAIRRFLIDESQVSFVNQSRRLQRVPLAFFTEASGRK
jgi:hypothetical protein